MSDDDPLADADVGETRECRVEHSQAVIDGLPLWEAGRDRESQNRRFENVRLELDDDGDPVLRWEQVADVTRTMHKREYQHWQAKREYEQHKREQKRQRKKRRSRIISTVLGGGLSVALAGVVMVTFPSMTINGETVSVGEFAGPMIFVVLLVVFVGLAIPYLPGRVMSA